MNLYYDLVKDGEKYADVEDEDIEAIRPITTSYWYDAYTRPVQLLLPLGEATHYPTSRDWLDLNDNMNAIHDDEDELIDEYVACMEIMPKHGIECKCCGKMSTDASVLATGFCNECYYKMQ